MDRKRLEIYVGWKCNQKCTYCIEFQNMEQKWNEKVTKYEILKTLIKYKKQGYNHVTFLGGEPFIQEVFLEALKIGKKLGYTILVTTNATTLHIEKETNKYLPYIDELILSTQAIDEKLQQKISRTNVVVKWEKVFENINNYGKHINLKTNIVITKDNLSQLINIVKFLSKNNIKNILLTYPDITTYYTFDHIKNSIAPSYKDSIKKIIEVFNFCRENNIKIVISDVPFCIFPKEELKKYIQSTNDFLYQTRSKIDKEGIEINRKKLEKKEEIPRERYWVKKCNNCIYKGKCWGPSRYYEELFGLDEINPIK